MPVRPIQHVIDTQAKRTLTSALPAEWEHRELTGRDYGIDLAVECFDHGEPSGDWLMFQLKGSWKDLSAAENETVSLDFPTRTLKYAELFAVPVIAAFVPVRAKPSLVRYVWLQEYIKVVLNFDQPTWRSNRRTVRLHVPAENVLPGGEAHLRSVAKTPRRANDLLEVHRLLHELRYAPDAATVARHLDHAETVTGWFGDDGFPLGAWLKRKYIDGTRQVLAGLSSLDANEPVDEVLAQLTWMRWNLDHLETDENAKRELVKEILGQHVALQVEGFSAGATQFHDYRLHNSMWRFDGSHRF